MKAIKANSDRYATTLGKQAGDNGQGVGFNPFMQGTRLWEQWEAGHRAATTARAARAAAFERQRKAMQSI